MNRVQRLPARTPGSANPVEVYLATLYGESVRTQRLRLASAARMLGGTYETFAWWTLDYPTMVSLRQALVAAHAPKEASSRLSTVKQVLKVCWRLGLMTGEQLQQAVDVPVIKPLRIKPHGRLLELDEIGRLFAVCAADRTTFGRRDAAMMAILFGTGIRRAELAHLQCEDYAAQTGALLVRRGKGDASRTVWVGTEAARQLVREWLAVRGYAPGPLFPALGASGTPRGTTRKARQRGLRYLSGFAIRVILVRRCREAGLPPASPHSFRRTAITTVVNALDLEAAQRFAGHARIDTTAQYVTRSDEIVRQAAAVLDIPPPPLPFDVGRERRDEG